MTITWIFSFLRGWKLTKAVLQLLFTSAPNVKGQNPALRFSESVEMVGRGQEEQRWASLSADSLTFLVTGNMISKPVLIIMYWDLNTVMQSLTLKKVFVNSSSWLNWAFHLCFWGRINRDLL